MKMVQGQTKYICSSPIQSASKDKDVDMKKSTASWTSKDQQPTMMAKKSYTGASVKQDSWGKIFKSEQHFKSMHIC